MSSLFFFNDTATTEIYTLSLHDALPILGPVHPFGVRRTSIGHAGRWNPVLRASFLRTSSLRASFLRASFLRESVWILRISSRSEEHTSELQSRLHLVCRLLLEKKKPELR